MSRFILSPAAGQDLTALALYLQSLPHAPALRIGKALQKTLRQLAEHPAQGHLHTGFAALANETIRSFVSGDYVIFYAAERRPVVFTGIIHGKRDIETIMRQRLR